MDLSRTAPPKPTARKLLAWYDRERRDLLWRAAPGEVAEPYRVWLSEIMLQQTTVTAVTPYFEKFLGLWPSLASLASASRDEVLTAWAGLGYYSRARNLHACARVLVDEQGGVFPQKEKELLKLPGIGAYTAAAITAIAFNKRAAVVDGNVERVMTRQFALNTPLPKVKAEVKALTETLVPKSRPGDFAQAMMDLGATICTPRSPDCPNCPWQKSCKAFASGDVLRFPVRPEKKPKPTRRGIVYWAETEVKSGSGEILIEQRPETGLLAAMWQFPTDEWAEVSARTAFAEKARAKSAPFEATWTRVPGLITHTFTHFHLELAIYQTRVETRINPDRGQFVNRSQLKKYALPSLMQKVAAHVSGA